MLKYQKFAVLGGAFVVGSVLFLFVGLDPMVKFGIRNQVSLKRKSEVRGIYLKLPFPLDFRVYFFNVSNPSEVQNGAKPILKEIGPYCYDEFIEKIEVKDNDNEDSLTYTPYNIFKFNKEKSGNLSEDDYVTVLNPLIVGMVNHVVKDSPALLSILNRALSPIFEDPQTIYLTEKVKNILFDGCRINCNVTDFTAKAVCSQLRAQIPGLKEPEPNILLFALLAIRNATYGKRVKVDRGVTNTKRIGTVLEYDGKQEINFWSTPDCNHFQGTDGWIIPPLLEPEEGIAIFSTDLCRNVHADYINSSTYKNVDVRLYQSNLGDMEHNEEDKCYCDSPNSCLKKGLMDLTKCLGVPLYATLPHFLLTDEMYLDQVEGLNPSMEKHIIELLLEPLTGTPLKASKRMQFNIQIGPVPKISLMRNLPVALHPIFWIEEIVHTTTGDELILGDADYYPSGGKNQTGCNNFGCSHGRAFLYYAESISSTKFVAKQCTSYTNYESGQCKNGSSSPMGTLQVDTKANGKYYLETNSQPPYAKGG